MHDDFFFFLNLITPQIFTASESLLTMQTTERYRVELIEQELVNTEGFQTGYYFKARLYRGITHIRDVPLHASQDDCCALDKEKHRAIAKDLFDMFAARVRKNVENGRLR